MDKDNFFVKSQIQSNIRDIKMLLDTGVFDASILRSFQEPAFVSIILKLNDLLQKYNQIGKRINFTDDIPSGDITDLVNSIRNAICHLDSGENLLDSEAQIKFVFNIIIGKGEAINIGNKAVAKSDYNDDIAFFYGENRLYFERHLLRVLKEAIVIARELYPDDPMFLL